MKFNCFPKKQEMYLVYSNYKVFRSKLFLDLTLQSSPKSSNFYRFLKSNIGYYFSSFFQVSINSPNDNQDYIGIVKKENYTFFEIDEFNNPTNVWRKSNNKWTKEKFIGYQLISEYSLNEFNIKYKVIENTLKKHWIAVNKNLSNIHGDLTHFNILINKEKETIFIDKKSINHSKIFDFFYFFSYINQCVNRTMKLKESDKIIIVNNLKNIIKKTCKYKSFNEFEIDFLNMDIPSKHGLKDVEFHKNKFLEIFS